MTGCADTTSPVLALFGGTFDPPHVGHVLAVHYVLLTSAVERVLVAPCAHHPFAQARPGKVDVSFAHRLAMSRLAFAGCGPRVEVIDLEGRRSGSSYTIDTVRDLRRLHPGHEIEVVIGSDNLADFGQWKEAAELRALAHLRVLPRLEEALAAEAAAPGPADGGAARLPFCLPRVSSTAVRALLVSGADASALVPRDVLAYAAAHGLYR